MVQIYVRGLEGSSRAVDVTHETSVGELKALISSRERVAPEEQRLRHGGWGLDDDQEMVLEHCQAGDTITLTASLLGGMPKKGGKKGGKEKKAKEPVSAPTLLECCLNEETARTRTHSSPSGFAPLAHGEREREWVPGNREASSSDGTSKSSARVAASCSTHASASAPAPAAAAKCTYTLAHWTTCVHVRSWLTNASACSCAG